MKSNKKGLSIVFAITLSLVSILLVILILAYIIPFSERTKGIENSAKSYYLSRGGIEFGLLFLKDRTSLTSETSFTDVHRYTINYSTNSTGRKMPLPGRGNSEFGNDFNRIRIGEPIQIEVGNNLVPNWNSVDFYFKVPDLDASTLTTETLSGTTASIINWQLSSSSQSLNSSLGNFVEANDICDSNDAITTCDINFSTKTGRDLEGVSHNFETFYNNNCTGNSCIFKMSVIGVLELNSNNRRIPYLNWQIDFGTYNVPLRFSSITSDGFATGYKKTLEINYPQQTLIEAFDFTVFQ